MKATGIIRRFDDLGRISIPKAIRNRFGITEDTPMEIYLSGEDIVLRKYDTKDKDKGELVE